MKRAIRLNSYLHFLILVLLYPNLALAEVDKLSGGDLEQTTQTQIDSLLALSENLAVSNPDTAVFYALEALKMEQEKSSGASAFTLKILADALYYQHEFMEALGYYQLSADAEKMNSGELSSMYAARINDVGYCYYMMGYYEMAVRKYNEALQILRQTNDAEELYTTLNNIGTVYFKWGEYAKSVIYFEQTLKYDLERGEPYNLSVTYNNIGKVYHASENPEKAIDYFTLALEQARLATNPRMEATALSNLGMIYFELKQFDKALLFIKDAMAINQKTGNSFKVAIRENEMAKVLAAKGDIKQAIDYCKRSLRFFESAKIQESQAIVLLDLGRFYKELKQFKNSEESYLKGLEIAQQIKSTYHAMLISKGLSELYESWGKTTLALKLYKQYTDYKSEIFNAEKNRQLADFEIKYQTRETEIENQLLKNENEVKQSRLSFLSLASVSLFILLVLLVFGVRLRTKANRQQKALAVLELQRKEQERLHLEDKVFAEKQINHLQQKQHMDEMEYKNKLLANSSLELIRKNEFLTELKSIISSEPGENGFSKKEIVNQINRNIDLDQNWKKFHYEFEESHPGFFDQLLKRYHDISETYIQLSAFLYIGLSTKEIAQLQNVSISAVNKNRQRLRKKFGLEAEADLTEHLKSLL